jgi:hypothetical protein
MCLFVWYTLATNSAHLLCLVLPVPLLHRAAKLLLAVLLLALLVFGGALLLHYWNHPELLPYTTLQRLQQASQQGPLQQACSAGSFPLHQHVCGWVQRAVRVLPPEHFGHDEL